MEHRNASSLLGLAIVEEGYRIGKIVKVCFDSQTPGISDLYSLTVDKIECVVPA